MSALVVPPDLARALHPGPPDAIELIGLRARGHHGVLEHERRDGQDFLVDLRMDVDTAPAGRADALGRTVNYAEVADSAVAEIEGGPHQLIETLAARIAGRILSEQILVRRIEVTLHKPSAPIPHPFSDVRVRIERSAPATPAVLALGTNLGAREKHLSRALGLLRAADGIEIDWTAPVVETDPVGGVAQDAFLNTVVGIRSERGPWRLLDLAHALEEDARRVREVRWGPRTLDVDLIAYGDLVQDDEELTLPHPRAHERAFVLAPWHAARPAAELPGHGPIGPLLARAEDRDGVRPGPALGGFGA
ncbi:2-amino-4-hydroxy-6-hydroxymethyldihydropteridine diphosphokinase [Brachybacterium sp. MASK1Z-5]|uniref:Bifunctional folate synthesis protein n=1 Tax=Brachybacterium halotolerans TaxID=2795215 RepID=A0ABS1BG16_9MICO|nr:2-amino-4-hydroxy-6-hydroxymethyldihydropteridine diphosphokinase [Brachybacterium halotolerans]MBK0332980.1 2-amino-4-hydroxy-6-hydroxymethyldihydropteridine diphosphokinase [Brachybacterium halotolerans]